MTADRQVPAELGVDLAALERAGFTPEVGKAIAFPSSTPPVLVGVGVGDVEELGTAELRDAAAAFARAVPQDARLATRVPSTGTLSAHDAAAAVVEGIVLARYQFSLRREHKGPVPLASLVLVAPEGAQEEVEAGARRSLATARAAALGRDLAPVPPACSPPPGSARSPRTSPRAAGCRWRCTTRPPSPRWVSAGSSA